MNTNRLIYVVAKSPQAGAVKTRLIGDTLNADAAASLARAFLADTLALCSHPALRADVRLALDGDATTLSLPDSLIVVPQQGDTLGERLQNLFAQAFAEGYASVLAVGADTPHLPLPFLIESFGWFAAKPAPDLILGPADDGGYFLIGLSGSQPALFADIAWSSEKVLAQTTAQANALKLRTALLPPWYDVDTPADLSRIRTDLQRGVVVAPQTQFILNTVSKGD